MKLVKGKKTKSNGRNRKPVDDNNFITKMLDDIDRHTPKTGYNLVGIDDFEPFGEQLYIIRHYDTYEAALAAQEQCNWDTAIYPHKREKEK